MVAKRQKPGADSEADAGAMLGIAIGDLATARSSRGDPDVPVRNAAYQAQQATEKALKAVIILENQPYDWIHDVEALAQQVPTDFTVPATTKELSRLSDLATSARYPDQDGPITDSDADQAIALAEAVVGAAIEHFERRGVAQRLYQKQ